MKCGNLKHYLLATCVSILVFFTSCFAQTVDTVSLPDNVYPSEDSCNLTDEELRHIFTKVDILADFKGGSQKWFEFAQMNFDFNSIIQDLADSTRTFQDSIFVKFIVTKSGQVCNVRILRGNPILAKSCIALIKKTQL